MTLRLPLMRWRIGVIFLTGALAMLTVPVALFYALRGADQLTGLPQPRQLAAIVSLIEDTPIADRIRVVNALRSAQLSIRVADEAKVVTDLAPLWPAEDAQSADYRAALGDRAFAAYGAPRKLFSRALASPLTAAEFRVALESGGVLIVASESSAFFTSRGMPLGFPSAFLGVVIAFVALILLNREFRPVLSLARAVEALDPSDPEALLPTIRARAPEVRTLIEAFTRQQARLATLLRARTALIGGIQHDVRTFATRLRLRIEGLPDDDARRHAETDIADLVALMDDALVATRGEAGQLDFELIDVGDLLRAEVHDRQAYGAGVDLAVQPEAEKAQILGDRIALRRIAFNLVDNALRYGKTARLTLSADDAMVTMMVEDDGPGIPKERRNDLMQPFSRLEPSRSRKTGGAGLGLAIVQTLVTAHGGRFSIEDAPIRGACVVVEMPIFAPSVSG